MTRAASEGAWHEQTMSPAPHPEMDPEGEALKLSSSFAGVLSSVEQLLSYPKSLPCMLNTDARPCFSL